MALFNHKVSLPSILAEIPTMELTRIAQTTGVDYYSKVLNGRLVFNLLLYGMLHVDRLSQRGLSDVFTSPFFRMLFGYDDKKKTIAHSAISERLSLINVDFFKQSYELLYKRFSSLYTKKEVSNLYLQRVDSSVVVEASNKLREGLTCGNEYKSKKMLKYTLCYDGMFGSCASTHTQECYASESLALPQEVKAHFKREEDHANVYLIDRGQCSSEEFRAMKEQQGLLFVGRLQTNRKLKVVRSFDCQNKVFEHGVLLEDALVQLYKCEEGITKQGKPTRRQVLVEETFRVIRFNPRDNEDDIVLITNIVSLRASTIAGMYRRRWDIEVFFRFLKQELNFSHFLSLNENGIQVVLYMTLITAMLVMIYKKENEIGFKTAVRRMSMELEGILMELAVVRCGGDLSKLHLPAP